MGVAEAKRRRAPTGATAAWRGQHASVQISGQNDPQRRATYFTTASPHERRKSNSSEAPPTR
jgi:hypothetical protein